MIFDYWRHYLKGTPEYLAHYYWWAYLAPRGVWFFDHGLVINLILFGQYRAILDALMQRYEALPAGRTLQLTCAYGEITPTLACSASTQELHVMDVAKIQLHSAKFKLQSVSRTATLARMNAESLAYGNNSFDCVVIFFLLHELPVAARQRILSETLRILKPGGRLLIAEYGENQGKHFLHRFTPWRWVIEKLEPFLYDFWHSDLEQQLLIIAKQAGKQLQKSGEVPLFYAFYRVMEYRA